MGSGWKRKMLLFICNKTIKICKDKSDASPPPDDGMWDQLQLQLIAKSEKNLVARPTLSVHRTGKTTIGPKGSKSKVKRSDGLGIETH